MKYLIFTLLMAHTHIVLAETVHKTPQTSVMENLTDTMSGFKAGETLGEYSGRYVKVADQATYGVDTIPRTIERGGSCRTQAGGLLKIIGFIKSTNEAIVSYQGQQGSFPPDCPDKTIIRYNVTDLKKPYATHTLQDSSTDGVRETN